MNTGGSESDSACNMEGPSPEERETLMNLSALSQHRFSNQRQRTRLDERIVKGLQRVGRREA